MYECRQFDFWFMYECLKNWFDEIFFIFWFWFLFFLCMHVWMKCNFRKCIIFWSTTLIILYFSFLFIILSYCKSNISSVVIEFIEIWWYLFEIFFLTNPNVWQVQLGNYWFHYLTYFASYALKLVVKQKWMMRFHCEKSKWQYLKLSIAGPKFWHVGCNFE